MTTAKTTKSTAPETSTSEVEYVEPLTVRVSESKKVGEHLLSFAIEGVPQAAAASVAAELVATMEAAIQLADLKVQRVPAPQANKEALHGPPTVAQTAPVAQHAQQAAGETVRIFPVEDFHSMKLAPTESGVLRVRCRIGPFQTYGIDAWPEVMLAAGVDPKSLELGQEYGAPAGVKEIHVRMKAPVGDKKANPDRITAFVLGE